MATATVNLHVGQCAKSYTATGRPVPHPWHICKPGGMSAWVCAGIGENSLEKAERTAAVHGAVTPIGVNHGFTRAKA